jgi:arylformamidase
MATHGTFVGASMESTWIDISVPIHDGMPRWPGDPPLVLERASSMDRGDEANVTRLTIGAHAGTHVDAPAHFLAAGAGVDEMPLDAMVGPARVLSFGEARPIARGDLEREAIREGERILLRTRNSDTSWFRRPFDPGYVHLSVEAAEYLARLRPRCVGIDYLSIGGFEPDDRNPHAHRHLLGAGVWIVEGLHLAGVEPGAYDLVCLPLRLEGADGAPARALVRRRPAADSGGAARPG